MVEIGKDWLVDASDSDRLTGLAMINHAASVYEVIISNFDDEVLVEDKITIVEDYARIASLQDEAKDSEGASKTALSIAPHLITLSKESLDEMGLSSIGNLMQLATLFIGDSKADLVARLLEAMPRENARQTRKMLAADSITARIRMADTEEAVKLIATYDKNPGFGLWHYLKEILVGEDADESSERAQALISAINQNFPKLFEESYDNYLRMVPTEAVLFYSGRDDLLTKYYASILRGTGDVYVLSKFAGECGFENNSVRFGKMIKNLKLSKEQSATLYSIFEAEHDLRVDELEK